MTPDDAPAASPCRATLPGPSRAAALPAVLAVVVGCAVASPPGAAAQHVPVDPPRPPQEQPETEGWDGSVDLGLTLTRGNSETLNLAFGASASRKFGEERLAFSSSYVRTTESGEEVANKGEARAKYDFFPGERFYVSARMVAGFNDPAGLSLRLAPGVGAGYTLAETPRANLAVEGGGNWIRDRFVNDSTSSAFFFSAAQTFTLKVNDDTDLSQELRYSPRATDFGDYLLQATAALTTMISDAVGLRVTVQDDYDATPFQGGPGEEPAEKNDVTLITSVTYTF